MNVIRLRKAGCKYDEVEAQTGLSRVGGHRLMVVALGLLGRVDAATLAAWRMPALTAAFIVSQRRSVGAACRYFLCCANSWCFRPRSTTPGGSQQTGPAHARA